VFAFLLCGDLLWWGARARSRAVWGLVGLVMLQLAVAAALVLLALPRPLQVVHVAVGTAVWAGLVLAAF
jgi:heme A synthase